MMPLLAYVGPETTLPLASALVACAGFLLTFWRATWRSVKVALPFMARERRARRDWRGGKPSSVESS